MSESKKKRTRNGRRKLVQKNGLLNISAESNKRVVVPSLFSINTMGPALNGLVPTADHRMVDSEQVPSNGPKKKNPFIIQAQSIGNAVSRTVLIDPNFGNLVGLLLKRLKQIDKSTFLDGFPKRSILKCKFIDRNESRTESHDLRRSLMIKRKSATNSKDEDKTEVMIITVHTVTVRLHYRLCCYFSCCHSRRQSMKK